MLKTQAPEIPGQMSIAVPMDVHIVTCSPSRREARQSGDPASESGEPIAAPSQNPTLSSSVTKMSSIYFDPACQTYYAAHNRNFSWSWAANNFYGCK